MKYNSIYHVENGGWIFFGDKVSKFSHKMQYVKNLDELFLSSISTFQEPSNLLINSTDISSKIFDLKKNLNNPD